MKNNCEIIRDLLPLYCDGVCSEASKRAVEEHLEECAVCKAVHWDLSKDADIPPINANEEKDKAKVLKGVKKKIILKRIIAVVVAVAITAGIGLLAANELLETRPVEYYDGIMKVDADSKGNLTLKMYVDGYSNACCNSGIITVNNEKKNILCVFAYSNTFSKLKNAGKIEEKTWDVTGLRGTAYASTDEEYPYYAIYYYIFEGNPMFNEYPDFEKELEENGHLLWKAE